MEKRGKLIVLEGIDGSGKSTQARKLVRWLKKHGYKAIYTKEPTDGLIGRQIKEKLRSEARPKHDWLQVMFASDRAHHTEEITRYLKKGFYVVCDRYVLSGLAYGAMKMQQAKLKKINKGIIQPDVTVLLKVNPLIAVKRMAKEKRRLELYKSPDMLRKVQVMYVELAKKNKKIYTVDGNREKIDVHEDIRRALKQEDLI